MNNESGYPSIAKQELDPYPDPENEQNNVLLNQNNQGDNGTINQLSTLSGKLLYQSNQGGTYNIYLQENTQEPINLTSDLQMAVEGSWSPDGKMIAFVTQGEDANNLIIKLMNFDGTNKISLLSEQPRLNWRPIWGPDSSQLLFISNRDNNFEIYKTDIQGSNVVNITDNPANDLDPDWSSNTNKIVFISNRETGNGVYVMDPDGSNVENLLNGDWKASFPRWSQNGEQIAFTSEKDGTSDIYIMDANGQNIQKITNRVGDNSMPEWISDDQILFSGDFGDETWDLYVINVDGTNLIQLTGQPIAQTYSERYPQWYP